MQFNRYEIISILRAAGALLNVSPLKLASELSCAAAKNDPERLKSFAMAGANMDQEGSGIPLYRLFSISYAEVSPTSFIN